MLSGPGENCFGKIKETKVKEKNNEAILSRNHVLSGIKKYVLRLLQCTLNPLLWIKNLRRDNYAKSKIKFFSQALAGFTKDNRIPQPLSIFDNEQVRFDHRFTPFYGLITPPPVSYNQFKDYRTYTLKNSSMNLYLDASNYFHRARSILEVIPNADTEVFPIK